MIKKAGTILLAASLVMTGSWTGVAAASSSRAASLPFADTNGHWAEPAIAELQNEGILNGYENGEFHPDDSITRAELAALLHRVMGWKSEAAKPGFTDVRQGAWYEEAVNAAVKTGIVDGYEDGSFRPDQAVTREETAAMMSRAFRSGKVAGDQEALASFIDRGEIGAFAVESLGDLYSEGVISGYPDGKLRPKQAVTRAESASMLHKLAGNLYASAGEFKESGTVERVTIAAPGVSLQGAQIHKSLLLTAGIGDGDVTLSKLHVQGSTMIHGGGSHSVHVDDSRLGDTIIQKEGEPVRLVLAGESSVQQVTAASSAILETTGPSSTFAHVIAAGDSSEVTLQGRFEDVSVSGHESRIVIGKDSQVASLIVNASAKNASIESKGRILKAVIQADGVSINNQAVAAGKQVQVSPDGKISDAGTGSPVGGGASSSGSTSPGGGGSSGDNQRRWDMVWNDEFNGTSIDASKWNFVEGGGGYGNEELQNYTSRPDNARIEDGNLIIEARKENFGGNPYTSAKLTSRDKGDWTYGRFEVRAKLPDGRGIWPAIWMMPSDDSLYGSWPGSGEIDIMEMLGHEPNKVYGTLHFGNPHAQTQKSYTLTDGSTFASNYHVFAVEWEPGEIRHYVDGVEYSRMNDWYTKSDNEAAEYTYPAPFDRDFFLQLNLAVGGSWPGNPDEGVSFPKQMAVDYVRVYKLDGTYREPGEPQILRGPDSTGNYVVNGDFNEGSSSWVFQPFAPPANLFGGEAEFSIDDGVAHIATTNEGRETYAVQLVQGDLPLQKGASYKLTFDARSDTSKTMIASISAPEHNYIRYLEDQTVPLSADLQTYAYTFVMNSNTDGKARLEFNMGKAGTAPVWIDHVKLVKIADPDPNPPKTMLPSGNLIYNGTFDQGKERKAYWSLETDSGTSADASVSDIKRDGRIVREMNVGVREGGAAPESVRLTQDQLQLEKDVPYSLLFQARADRARNMEVRLHTPSSVVTFLNGSEVPLTTEMSNYEKEFTLSEAMSGATLAFLLGGSQGTVTLDNVRLVKRGAARELSGYLKLETDQYWGMDGIQVGGDGVVGYLDEGDSIEYKLQVTEGGQYRTSIRAASEAANSYVRYTLQNENRQIVQSGTLPVGNTGGWGVMRTFSLASFDLQEGTYFLTLGGDKYNSDWIEWSPELVQNGDFSQGMDHWTLFKADGVEAVQPSYATVRDGALQVELADPGSEEWHVQVKQDNLKVTQDKTYKVQFTVSSSVYRDMRLLVQENGGSYKLYNGGDVYSLTAEPQTFESTFTMSEPSDSNAVLVFSLGQMNGVSGAHTVTLDHVSMTEIAPPPAIEEQPLNTNLLTDGEFNQGIGDWASYSAEPSELSILVNAAGKLQIHLGTAGANPWDRQVFLPHIHFQQGYAYTLKFKAKSTKMPRKMNVNLGWLDEPAGYVWNGYHGQTVDLTDDEQLYSISFVVTSTGTDLGRISFDLGNLPDGAAGGLDVELDDFELTNNGRIAE